MVIAIIAVLVSLLLPALAGVRSRMKQLQCSSNLRTVAFRFQLFAAGEGGVSRGDSDERGRRSFFINDFQESLYGIDEFWSDAKTNRDVLTQKGEPMLCPAGARRLVKRRGHPCSSAAVGPPEDVSLAVNMRLYRVEVEISGMQLLSPVYMTHVRQDVLSHPYVPLIFDVNGAEAARRGIEPFYSAPPGDPAGVYGNGHYWMPSDRHGGRTVVAFTGGHVLTSTHPEQEPWDWAYQAEYGH